MTTPTFLCRSLVCLLCVEASQALSFKPNCTLPPPGTNYVSAPNTRSTLTILWSNLSTILLCTWSIQHLNVPAMRPDTDSALEKMKRSILDFRIKVKWMLLTILVPEYLVGKAFGERLAAKAGVKAMFALVSERVTWEEVHAYMANMGYFVLQIDNDTKAQFKDEVANILGALTLSNSEKMNMLRFAQPYWALNNTQWSMIVGTQADLDFAGLPEVSSEQLQKLDKGGTLVKVLALSQITYLIVQLVARKVADLPSTQLEIATLAFSALSFATYFLYWNRPQGIETIHIIKARENPISQFRSGQGELPSTDDMERLAALGPTYSWLSDHRAKTYGYDGFGPAPIPNDAIHLAGSLPLHDFSHVTGSNDEAFAMAFGTMVGGMLFGGLHYLA
ncbi:hypothetical protein AOQ84DRAFT_414796 [Glonium stellatum]|uniref:Uncharacterized protein n=1 Tax=Glonium stellatum TaxID=574774 RepID=A0A8E2JY42_9PEZI|nr:hypothetical protein AOQ84DRAFT_414796 [Glonium stellatum]